MRDLLADVARRAATYLEGLDDRRVGPAPDAVEGLARFHEALPEQPCEPAEVVRMLDEVGSPATMAISGPRFFGFVIGGSLPATLACNWLATAWDQNSGLRVATPVATVLEDVALGWLLDVLQLPSDSSGAFVTGATMANFTALSAARHSVLLDAGWDVEAKGLYGAPELTVVVSAEAHPSLFRSLGLLGLGRERVMTVPVDDQGRMRAEAFPKLSGPSLVCVQAGNVNTGAFDPIDEICDMSRDAGAWVHVDGAFGLWAAATPAYAHLARGVEKADSWATDAHKLLNVPYDSGLAFVRDGEPLREAMALRAAYLPTGERREPSQYTPELSRRARGVDVWAAMRSLGRGGIAEMVERTCRHAQRFAKGLDEAGFEILNDVVFNQVLVSFGDADKTRRTIAAIQEDGTSWCGGTEWQDRVAMRISVSSWATSEADVERSLDAMIEAARRS